MNQEILIAVFVSFHLSTCLIQAIFIQPQPSITNLSTWASIQVDQVCNGNCYSDFNNIACSQSKVCRSIPVCNGRTELPAVDYPLKTWPKTSDKADCRISNTPPNSQPPTTFSEDRNQETFIVNGTAGPLSPCYIHRNGSVDSIFTLVFWLMATCANCSVLELSQSTAQPIHVNVLNDQICVNAECQNLRNNSQQWTLISVRVVRDRLTIYVDDAPFKNRTNTLTNINYSDIVIGSYETASAKDVFSWFNVRYYKDALTLSEIIYLKTGFKHPIFGDCHCPVNYLEEIDENNCSDGTSNYARINFTIAFNEISAIVDGDNNTNWATSDQGNVTITLYFNVSFQIESLLMTFDSVLPYQVSFSLYSGEQQKYSGFFHCDPLCRFNMTSLNNMSTKAEVTSYVADRINIQLHCNQPEKKQNFIISAIEVTGRCNCNGNADKCTLNYGSRTYLCSCNQETHTTSQQCQSCSENYFRSSDQFDCPNSCHCNTQGVANVSNQCEEMGGRCKCKGNVDGLECESCKPFSYMFGSSPTNGCVECSCSKDGALKCSDTDGSCVCRPNTESPSCDKCMPESYGFNTSEGCQLCNCNVAGTVGQNKNCDESTGQCNCKANVQGRKCESCKPGFYNVETANQQGCQPCKCHNVGTSNGACESGTGQCLCRGGIVTNKQCSPVISSVDPTYGPFVGGTLVTINGSLLGNITHGLAVFLNEVPQELVSVSDNETKFRTAAFNTLLQQTQELKLSWKNDSSSFNTQTTFTYKSNPVLNISKGQNVTAFVSGGCQVRIYGTNLESVKYPQLEVALVSNPMNKTTSICRHVTDYVNCPIPDLRGLYTSALDKYQMTAIFDGIKSSEFGNLEVKPDPQFNNVGTIKFQYPFEDTIVLSGKDINAACQTSEFSVATGVINCAITHISSSQIKCAPAVSPPGGYKYYPIEVRVGNFYQNVGTLQYLELRETTGFIIIISCASVAVAIVIAAIIFCIFWRRRKAPKSASPLIAAEDKEVVTGETNVAKTYSELPERTPEVPVIETNGHIEPILQETIFQEPKKGIVNTEAEDTIMKEEFLPKVEEGLRDDIRKCYVGAGHFVTGRYCSVKGKHAQLIDGSLQKSRTPAVKLTIKSLIRPITESQLPAWGNQGLRESLRFHQYNHPSILSILGIGINKERFHLLYPRMSQYVLKTLISDTSKGFSVRQLIRFGQQVAEGIVFLSSKGITHKDVATRNCMVDEHSVVKLCDAAFSWDFFGEEYVYDEQRERYLPIRWMAPESIKDGYYDMRTDVWSFAVLVWELLTRGCLPYHEATNPQEISNFIKEGYILGKPDIMEDTVYDLLSLCWSQQNEHRPSIAEVSKSLEDILKTDDDGTYANTAEVSAHMKNQKDNVMLRLSPGSKNNPYKTSRLSRV